MLIGEFSSSGLSISNHSKFEFEKSLSHDDFIWNYHSLGFLEKRGKLLKAWY